MQREVSTLHESLHFEWHQSCARGPWPTLLLRHRRKHGQEEAPKMMPTLGLTGVTVNAMALIAPGAFLWITFVLQAGYVFPSGMAMWAGIFVALMLAYATAISYSELAKLYPGAGSSYLFAEQAFLGKTTRVPLRANRQVRDRMGLASLLLGLSGRDGRDDGRHGRLHRGIMSRPIRSTRQLRDRSSWRWSRLSSRTPSHISRFAE